MKTEPKKMIPRIIIGIIKSGLIAFVLYFIALIPIKLFVYGEDYSSERDFNPIYGILIAIYALANYWIYIRKHSENWTFILTTGKFSPKDDLMTYLKAEGKYLLVIYGILAVIDEVSQLTGLYPISTALLMIFPAKQFLHSIPILRSVIGYLVTVCVVLALTVLEHYRVFKYWNDTGSD